MLICRGLRRFTLASSAAHGLYEKFGFTTLNKPELFMGRQWKRYAEKICKLMTIELIFLRSPLGYLHI